MVIIAHRANEIYNFGLYKVRYHGGDEGFSMYEYEYLPGAEAIDAEVYWVSNVVRLGRG